MRDRQGIGRKTFITNKQETNKQLKAEQLQNFQEHQKLLQSTRQLHCDLIKCQSACEQLDTTHVSFITVPIMIIIINYTRVSMNHIVIGSGSQ